MFRASRFAASLSVVVLLAATTGASSPQSPELMPAVITRETVLLAAERLMIERQYPARPKAETENAIGVPVDIRILMGASQSPNPVLRKVFVRSLGRIEEPTDISTLIPFLNDVNRDVRTETMNAIVQCLVGAKVEKNGREISAACDALMTSYRYRPRCDLFEVCLRPQAAQAIASLPLTDGQVQELARLFSVGVNAKPSEPGAIEGLATLARRNRNLSLSAATVKRLRLLAVGPFARPDPLGPIPAAMDVLSSIGDADVLTINKAAMSPNLYIRRVGVLMINGASPDYTFALRDAMRSESAFIRLAAVQVYGRAIPELKTCGPLIDALRDQSPHVVISAIDRLNPVCEERDDIAARLESWVNELSDSAHNDEWQARARALEAFAKFQPEKAKKIANETIAAHELWQVRATAARVAGSLSDEALAERLSSDEEPNVRTEALDALAKMQSPRRLLAAVSALESKDYLLVLTAALQLKRVALGSTLADAFAPAAQVPLLAALKRLTLDDKDTSRDPRVELLGRLAEYGDRNNEDFLAALREYLKDTDPAVATAAADALGMLTGTRPDPRPTRRKLEQPSETDLIKALTPPPAHTGLVEITMRDGRVIGFVPDIEHAPLTIYRLRKAAESGYYRGLTFHRVVPGQLAQGGSPGANWYSGASRFWPDETGGKHNAGSVVLSARGRHTGDAQFFILLDDEPGFDHQYTVFGCGAAPTFLVEGAVIEDIVVFAPRSGSGRAESGRSSCSTGP